MNEEERKQMLKDLEDDLWNFLQDAADGIKHPKDIKTDDKWPTI